MNKDAVRVVRAREDAARTTRETVARLTFGDALEVLRAGGRVSHVEWDGKGMWLVLIRAGNAMHRTSAGSFDMQDCIGLKTADGKMHPGWVPSQAHMLSHDWIEVK